MFGENAAPTPNDSVTQRASRIAKRRPNLQRREKNNLFCVKENSHILLIIHFLLLIQGIRLYS